MSSSTVNDSLTSSLNDYDRILEALHMYSTELSKKNTMMEIAIETRRILTDVFGFNEGNFAVVEDDQLVFIGDVNWKAPQVRIPLSGSRGITVRAVREGVTQLVADTKNDPDWLTTSEDFRYSNSEIDVPVKVDGAVVAVINVESDEPNKYTETEKKLLEILAEHIASAIKRLQSIESEKEYNKKLESLHAGTKEIATVTSRSNLFKVIFKTLEETLGFEWAGVGIGEKEGIRYLRDADIDDYEEKLLDYAGQSITARVFRTGETQLINDLRLDPGYYRSTKLDDEDAPSMLSELIVPVMYHGKVEFAINLERKKVNSFSEMDRRLIEILADHCSTALERIENRINLQEYEVKLEALNKIAAELNQVESRDELFIRTTTTLRSVLNTPFVGLGIVYPDSIRFGITFDESVPEIIIPFDSKAISLRAMRTKKSQLINDVSKDPDYFQGKDTGTDTVPVMYSDLIVPIINKGEVFAVLNLEKPEKKGFDEYDRKIVEMMATHLSSQIDRINQTQSIKENENRLQAMNDSAADAIIMVNSSDIVVSWNRAAEEIFGYTKDEVTGMRLRDLIIQPQFYDVYDEQVKDILEAASSERAPSREAEIMRKDGETIFIETTYSVIPMNNEPHILRMIRNVSQRKKDEKVILDLLKETQFLNKELESSNTELENYSYVVSHDLKSPLRSIQSFGGFLLEDCNDSLDEDGKEYLDRIISAAAHMDELIGDLLTLSRVGRKFMEKEEVDLNEMLSSIQSDLSGYLESRNAVIRINTTLPTLVTQSTWMRQLFTNMISNGIKFNESVQPTITIDMKEDKEKYNFTVADNGIGIDEQYFDRIFALFERLHTKEQYEGTGAGLAICKKIVEDFGGKLWLESKIGEGSTFYFTFPKTELPPSS